MISEYCVVEPGFANVGNDYATQLRSSRFNRLLKNLYIYVYNFKNARNGKSASKITIWPSLRDVALKNKFIWKFEFLVELENIFGKCY